MSYMKEIKWYLSILWIVIRIINSIKSKIDFVRMKITLIIHKMLERSTP